MKLSELAKQIADYIAENGDVEVKAIDFGGDVGEFREPVLEVEDYGNINAITL